MTKLLEKRTTVSAGEFPKLVKANWPIGKVAIYRDRFVFSAGIEEFTLAFGDIDQVDIRPGQVNFYHHKPGLMKDIGLTGFFIPGIIRKAIKDFDLQVPVKS